MFILSGLSEAVNFLTIFKFKGKNNNIYGDSYSYEDSLKKSIKYFPLVGLLIGIALAVVFYIFDKFLPEAPSVLISIIFLYVITGGLHFDGLSDTTDGLFAFLKSGDKTRFYKAMKDVNAGIAGNTAVIFYVLIMWSLISNADVNFIYLSLITFPVIGRYSIVAMSYFSDTPDNFNGIGAVFTKATGKAPFIAASILTFIIIYLLLHIIGVFSLLTTIFIMLLIAFYFAGRFGGVNGDILGFTVKISEVVYLIALIGLHRIF